jgi:hypothetical protein
MALIMGCVIMVCAMITIQIQTLFQLAINVSRRINLRINVNILQGCPVGFVLKDIAKAENLVIVIAMKTTIVLMELVMPPLTRKHEFACE